MNFEWDEAKDGINRDKHGIGFDAVAKFVWETAIILIDERRDYGESRQRAIGFLAGRLHVLIFTLRGNNRRIISLRRANKREEKLHETFQRR